MNPAPPVQKKNRFAQFDTDDHPLLKSQPPLKVAQLRVAAKQMNIDNCDDLVEQVLSENGNDSKAAYAQLKAKQWRVKVSDGREITAAEQADPSSILDLDRRAIAIALNLKKANRHEVKHASDREKALTVFADPAMWTGPHCHRNGGWVVLDINRQHHGTNRIHILDHANCAR